MDPKGERNLIQRTPLDPSGVLLHPLMLTQNTAVDVHTSTTHLQQRNTACIRFYGNNDHVPSRSRNPIRVGTQCFSIERSFQLNGLRHGFGVSIMAEGRNSELGKKDLTPNYIEAEGEGAGSHITANRKMNGVSESSIDCYRNIRASPQMAGPTTRGWRKRYCSLLLPDSSSSSFGFYDDVEMWEPKTNCLLNCPGEAKNSHYLSGGALDDPSSFLIRLSDPRVMNQRTEVLQGRVLMPIVRACIHSGARVKKKNSSDNPTHGFRNTLEL
ncbi:hypothetical protein JTE90_009352 [Oedothorax gibbosus]|uniref:Uncharacterized protein n=1 Tax=Oedothorax gibbosus TaxID=931172 RepID=A0AAV6VTQ2_9ARAC|nr:hypothetical protein JTE90_009352 [Oedothorax gibbosus]